MVAAGAILALVFLAIPNPRSASASTTGAATTSASQTLEQCLTTSNKLDVLFLIDESGSLTTTDPHAVRVAGIQSALAGLARLAASNAGGQQPTVEVLFEGFAGAVHPDPFASPQPVWSKLTGATLPQVEAIAQAFKSRDYASNTDYALALRDARVLLQHKAVEQTTAGGVAPCKAIIWITDGGYEISPRASALAKQLPTTEPYAPGITITSKQAAEAARKAGKQYLCRPGGLLDGLAADAVVRFTVGLSPLMSTEQQNFLEAATVGSGGRLSCGTGLSSSTGQYLGVAHADCLFFVLGGLLEGRQCPQTRRVVCTPSLCERGANAFHVPLGVASFSIKAATGGERIVVHLRAPDGQEAEFLPGQNSSTELGGARVTSAWRSRRTVEIEGVLPATTHAWAGNWNYTFVDPTGHESEAVPISSVYLTSGLRFTLPHATSLVRGQTNPVAIQLAPPVGLAGAADPLLNAAIVSASLTNPLNGASETVKVEPTGTPGAYNARVPVALSTAAPSMLLNVTASFPFYTGAPVVPVAGSFSLPVVLPPGAGYPSLATARLQFKSIVGSGASAAPITVVGSGSSGGCFSTGSPRAQPPEGTGSSETRVQPPSSRGTCVRLSPGQRRTVKVVVHVSRAGYGTMRVLVPVSLRSGLTGDTVAVDISGAVELRPATNVAKRVAIVVLLLAGGIVLPLMLLWALNWWGAQFSPPQEIRFMAREVTVSPGGDVKPAEYESLSTHYREDFDVIGPGSRRVRSISLDASAPQSQATTLPELQLRAIAAASLTDLFSGPHGEATVPDYRVVGPRGNGGSAVDAERVIVTLALWDTWLFCPTAIESVHGYGGDPTTIRGRLILFIRDGGDIAAGARTLARATSELTAFDWRAFNEMEAGHSGRSTRRWRIRWPFHAPARQNAPEPTREEADPLWSETQPDPGQESPTRDDSKGEGIRF